jgi:hypothetical protein
MAYIQEVSKRERNNAAIIEKMEEELDAWLWTVSKLHDLFSP